MTPAFGDISMVDCSLLAGPEMGDPHPGLVTGGPTFNRQFSSVLCPVTSTVRNWPFEVRLTGAYLATSGAALHSEFAMSEHHTA